jgi:DNA-binding NarL/FixJ family response regulator
MIKFVEDKIMYSLLTIYPLIKGYLVYVKCLPMQKIERRMINVHITDDQVMMVELLVPVINASGFAQISGCSHTLSECRKKLLSECPDVLLLDINMPDESGIVFCEEMHKQYPQMKIVALTESAITLTSREMQVLQLVTKGLSYPQIAEQLIIAPVTVNSYQKKLHLKFGAKTRFELIENAKKEGFIKKDI